MTWSSCTTAFSSIVCFKSKETPIVGKNCLYSGHETMDLAHCSVNGVSLF